LPGYGGSIGGDSVPGSGSTPAATRNSRWYDSFYNTLGDCAVDLLSGRAHQAFSATTKLKSLIASGTSLGILSENEPGPGVTNFLSRTRSHRYAQRDRRTFQKILGDMQKISTEIGLTAPLETQTASSDPLKDPANDINRLREVVLGQSGIMAGMKRDLESLTKGVSDIAASLSANKSDSGSAAGYATAGE